MKKFLFLVIILILVLGSCNGHAHSFRGDVLLEDGAYYQLCECGERRTHEHLFEETVITEPSCVSEGEAKYNCVACTAEEMRRLEKTGENGHEVYLYELTESTCSKEGKEIYRCKDCDVYIEEKSVPKLEHTVVVVEEKPSTCIQNGESEHSICSVCDAFITEKQSLLRTEHTFKDGYCTMCESSVVMYVLGYRMTMDGSIEGSIANTDDLTVGDVVIPYYAPFGSPVTEIEGFRNNQIITSVIFQANPLIPEEAFKNCEKLRTVVLPQGMSVIPTSTFQSCEALENVELPLGLETIEKMAFSDCVSLESIEFPDTVATIGNSAFHNCNSLKSVVLPKNLTTLSEFAFNECENLESVTISKNTRVLERYCFMDCYKLKTIYYEGTMEQWGMVATKGAFQGTDIEKIICSDGTIEVK